MERLALAHDGNGRRWQGQVELALAALFEYLAAEPGLARVWLVELRPWARPESSATSAP